MSTNLSLRQQLLNVLLIVGIAPCCPLELFRRVVTMGPEMIWIVRGLPGLDID